MRGQRKPSRRVLAFLAGLAGALLTAAAAAVGTDLGRGIVGLTKSEPSLVTSSATEQIFECGTNLFVAEPKASGIVSGGIRTPRDWNVFDRQNDAVVVEKSDVEISIQGESERPITLTGIDVEVERKRRPAGAVFSNPCGGPGTGRYLLLDLDRSPPQIAASSDDPEAVVGAPSGFRPIRFPWLVSLTDPLLLHIVARTERCYCIWRAFITWKSGSRSGQIAVDNDGEGYAVVGRFEVPHYLRGNRGWARSDIS